MQCKEVEVVLAEEGWAPLPDQARAHVASCSACQNLVADLREIVATAHQLPAEVDPPARVWFSLREQLEAEGIIKTPRTAAGKVPWWAGFSELLRGRALATAAVALLIVAAGLMQFVHQPAAPAPKDLLAETGVFLEQQETDVANMRLASDSGGDSDVDHSFRQSLQTLDAFIADCQKHVNENPQDDLAREYLTGAYQQKAQLLSAMMDRGRSEN
jgi:hypothetical protein